MPILSSVAGKTTRLSVQISEIYCAFVHLDGLTAKVGRYRQLMVGNHHRQDTIRNIDYKISKIIMPIAVKYKVLCLFEMLSGNVIMTIEYFMRK